MGTDRAMSPQNATKSSKETIPAPPILLSTRPRRLRATRYRHRARLTIRSNQRNTSISMAPSGTAAYGMLMGTPRAGDSWFRFSRARPNPLSITT